MGAWIFSIGATCMVPPGLHVYEFSENFEPTTPTLRCAYGGGRCFASVDNLSETGLTSSVTTSVALMRNPAANRWVPTCMSVYTSTEGDIGCVRVVDEWPQNQRWAQWTRVFSVDHISLFACVHIL